MTYKLEDSKPEVKCADAVNCAGFGTDFYSSGSFECKKCDSSCATCSGTGPEKCLTCKSGEKSY